MLSKKEQQQKDLKSIMSKPIGKSNPVFEQKLIQQLHSMFSLYADPRQRRAQMKDLLLTASTLRLDQKYEFVYRVINQIDQSNHNNALDFQGFLTELTKKVGNPFTDQGRQAHFQLLDRHGKGQLDLNDLRYINQKLHYGFQDHHLIQLIHTIAGFQAQTIPMHKFVRYMASKISKRRTQITQK